MERRCPERLPSRDYPNNKHIHRPLTTGQQREGDAEGLEGHGKDFRGSVRVAMFGFHLIGAHATERADDDLGLGRVALADFWHRQNAGRGRPSCPRNRLSLLLKF